MHTVTQITFAGVTTKLTSSGYVRKAAFLKMLRSGKVVVRRVDGPEIFARLLVEIVDSSKYNWCSYSGRYDTFLTVSTSTTLFVVTEGTPTVETVSDDASTNPFVQACEAADRRVAVAGLNAAHDQDECEVSRLEYFLGL